MTDPIADYLTRVRNAIMAKHEVVEIPGSNIKKDITKILYDKGYILGYKFEEDKKQGLIRIVLNGLGIAILSTSQGVMTDKEARKMNIGGEVLCFVH
jgi:small subunit ribosomal protein S8